MYFKSLVLACIDLRLFTAICTTSKVIWGGRVCLLLPELKSAPCGLSSNAYLKLRELYCVSVLSRVPPPPPVNFKCPGCLLGIHGPNKGVGLTRRSNLYVYRIYMQTIGSSIMGMGAYMEMDAYSGQYGNYLVLRFPMQTSLYPLHRCSTKLYSQWNQPHQPSLHGPGA